MDQTKRKLRAFIVWLERPSTMLTGVAASQTRGLLPFPADEIDEIDEINKLRANSPRTNCSQASSAAQYFAHHYICLLCVLHKTASVVECGALRPCGPNVLPTRQRQVLICRPTASRLRRSACSTAFTGLGAPIAITDSVFPCYQAAKVRLPGHALASIPPPVQ